jgi:5-hydroxyisourate hydrolase-like protein (transthyretin family)
MSAGTRALTLALGVAAATTLVAAPALAAAPAVKPTALTLKAAHATVAPKHKVSLTATLKSQGKPVAGASVSLESRSQGSTKFGNPVPVDGVTDAAGRITVPVVPGNKKGHKQQYEVTFAGDAQHKASHSRVITITVD